MKRILFLIPILFISVKPYNQTQTKEVSNIAEDTLILSKVHDSISIELKRSKELDERKAELQKELAVLKKKKTNLEQLKKAMEKFNNRGL